MQGTRREVAGQFEVQVSEVSITPFFGETVRADPITESATFFALIYAGHAHSQLGPLHSVEIM